MVPRDAAWGPAARAVRVAAWAEARAKVKVAAWAGAWVKVSVAAWAGPAPGKPETRTARETETNFI